MSWYRALCLQATEHFVLFGLDAIAGQAWLDGAKSIVDPRFNDGSDRYHL